jgi:hypothetical protein
MKKELLTKAQKESLMKSKLDSDMDSKNTLTDNWWQEIDSQIDPEEVDSWRETKETLKNYDPAMASSEADFSNLDDDFFDQLHTKIMTKVAEAEISKSGLDAEQIYRRRWKQGSAVALWALAVIISKPLHKEDNSKIASDQLYLQFADNPEIFARTVLNYESQDDVLAELARVKVSDLNAQQLNSILKEQGSSAN